MCNKFACYFRIFIEIEQGNAMKKVCKIEIKDYRESMNSRSAEISIEA